MEKHKRLENPEQIAIINAVLAIEELRKPFFNIEFQQSGSNYWIQAHQNCGLSNISTEEFVNTYKRYLNDFRQNALQNKAYSCQANLQSIKKLLFQKNMVFYSSSHIKQCNLKQKKNIGILEKAVYLALIDKKLSVKMVLRVFDEARKLIVTSSSFPDCDFQAYNEDNDVELTQTQLVNEVDEDYDNESMMSISGEIEWINDEDQDGDAEFELEEQQNVEDNQENESKANCSIMSLQELDLNISSISNACEYHQLKIIITSA